MVSNYVWTLPAAWTGTSTANSINATVINNPGEVYVYAVNSCGSSATDSLTVSIYAAPTVISPITINCGDTAVLNAASNVTISWYNAPTGGAPIDTGATFTTPPLNYNTTYYVQNDIPGTSDYDTPFDNNFGNGGYNQFAHYQVFNVLSPCNLVSVLVYAGAAGYRTITLSDGAGNTLDSVVVNLPNGQSRIILNFNLPVGGGLQLACLGAPNLYRNSSGAAYPYNDADGFISIVGNDVGDMGRYYFFYDWELLGADCGSGRIPVVVNVTNGTLANFTYTHVGNAYVFTNTSINATSYRWNFGDGDTSILQNTTHTYATNGIYTVTLIVTNGSCSDTLTQILDINTGIYSPTANTSLNVYPDPVNDNLIISLTTLGKSEWNIILYDVLGQTILRTTMSSTSGNNQKQLDFSKISKGVYTLELQNKDEKLIRKIVKE
jgi:hypothetical protein